MANYIVSDTEMTATAEAVRQKGGTAELIPWKAGTGFADTVEAIPSGGGNVVTELIDGTLTSLTNNDAVTVRARAFEQLRALTSVSLPNVVSINSNSFYQASELVNVDMKRLQTISGSFVFSECTSLTVIALPALTMITGAYTFRFDSKLEAVDLGAPDNLQQQTFASCTKLKKIILRRENGICALGGTNSFTSTPFASGGSGGTIYIPKVLYDHLGDGSALDYKAATNWSTLDGYGTITWAQIEGSQYEHYYADGTPIT